MEYTKNPKKYQLLTDSLTDNFKSRDASASKNIPIIREQEGNEKNTFPKLGNGKGMKKSICIIQERESEAFILGNGREREFPLTPAMPRYLI